MKNINAITGEKPGLTQNSLHLDARKQNNDYS